MRGSFRRRGTRHTRKDAEKNADYDASFEVAWRPRPGHITARTLGAQRALGADTGPAGTLLDLGTGWQR